MIVANARQVKWITASDQKNDRADARKLALLARADVRLLSPVEHRSAEQQGELGVIRARDAVVRARTLLVNAARGIAKGFGQRLPVTVTATFGKRALAMVPPILKAALEGLLAQIDGLGRQIQDYEDRIAQAGAQHPELERLVSIPGVGTLTALTFVLTLGRAERFAHSRDVAGYVGLRPKQKQSGTQDPQLGISKSGDKYLRKLLVQCAHHILEHWGRDSALRQWGLAKSGSAKGATKRAIGRWRGNWRCCCIDCGSVGSFINPFLKWSEDLGRWNNGAEPELSGDCVRVLELPARGTDGSAGLRL